MAYLVFKDGSCVKICSNDEEKNNLVLPHIEEFVIKDVSDANFTLVKSNQKWVSLSNDTITYTDITQTVTSSASLRKHFDILKPYLLHVKNHPSHPIHDGVVAYVNYLDSVDTDSIIPNEQTPLEYSWEKYCLDNSITYYHPLQIP